MASEPPGVHKRPMVSKGEAAPLLISRDVPGQAHTVRSSSKAGSAHSFTPGEDRIYSSHDNDVDERASWWRRVLLDTWVPEILALTTSTACLIAIVIVLHIFGDKSTPTLPYNITLNAVLVTLSSASRSMLIYTVAATISQLKWLWYLKSRKLQHMQIFDDASRGPWGSLTLLYSLRAKPLASLGAVVTVLAIAVDPFVQLILTYPSRMIVDHNQTPSPLARALTFTEPLPSSSFNNALDVGITTDAQQFYQQPSCPTGNCSWPNYHSIGWCSQCIDARSNAQLTDCSWRNLFNNSNNAGSTGCYASVGHGDTFPLYTGLEDAAIPGQGDGLYTSAKVTEDAVWLLHSHSPRNQLNDTFWPHETNQSTTFLGVEDPVVAFAHISVSWLLNNRTQPKREVITAAEECILTLCDQEYQVSTVNGTIHTNIIATNYGSIKNYYIKMMNPYWISCWQERNQTMQVPPESLGQNSSIFCPGPLGTHYVGEADDEGSYAATIAQHIVGAGSVKLYNINQASAWDFITLGHNDSEYTSPTAQYLATHGLSSALSGVAASLSRLSVDLFPDDAPYPFNSANLVYGVASKPQTYVRVAWYWLIYPFVLSLCGIVFLALAMIQSRRKKVKPWKASILPVLYHGLEAVALNKQRAQDVSAMERVAEKTEVRFSYLADGGKTMLKLT